MTGAKRRAKRNSGKDKGGGKDAVRKRKEKSRKGGREAEELEPGKIKVT